MIEKRQIIILAITAAVIAGSVGISKAMKPGEEKKRGGKPELQVTREEFTVKVKPFTETISLSGKAEAVQSMELTPTVAGTMIPGTKPFRAGTRFKAGEILFRIDEGTFGFDLRAKRTLFHGQILKVLPELAVDFPKAAKRWEQFASAISADKSLPALPKATSERERMVLVARELYSTYWTIRGLEDKQDEYTITAPFDGVVTVALSSGRSYLTAGRNVGTFTGNRRFEIALAVPASQISAVAIGSPVNCSVMETGAELKLTVARINTAIDPQTRTVNIYLTTDSPDLFENSFVTAKLNGKTHTDAALIPARFMRDGSSVRIKEGKKGGTAQAVTVIARLDSGVVVTGLAEGTTLTR